jgi:ABC-type glycerol-3-phosphate transport system substrate-binding protein
MERFTVQYRGGEAPDVVRVAIESVSRLVQMGAAMPLDSLIDQEGSGFLDPYYDNAVSWGTVDGTLYGIPNRIGAQLLYRNTEMYEEAGLDPTKGPETWEELKEHARRLTVDEDGDGTPDQYGYQLVAARTSSTTGRLIRWFWDNDARILSDDYSEAVIDSPEAVEAFTFWVSLYKDGYVPPGVTSADFQVATTNWSQGRVAHWQSGPWTIGQTLENNPDMEGKFAVSPLPNNAISQGGATFYMIPEGNEKAEAAWEFIKFATNRENQAKWTVETTLLPGRSDAAEDPRIANDPLLADFFDALGAVRPVPRLPEWREIEEVLWDAVQSALTDEKSPEQALKDAKVDMDAILQRN